MKELIGSAINEMLIPKRGGTVKALGELVLVYDEPIYGADAKGLFRERAVGEARICMGVNAMRKLSAAFAQYADALEATERRINATVDPTESPDFKEWFDEVKAEAERRGVTDLLGQPSDHAVGFMDGDSPADEVQAQIDAAKAMA